MMELLLAKPKTLHSLIALLNCQPRPRSIHDLMARRTVSKHRQLAPESTQPIVNKYQGSTQMQV